ncbi:MAG: multidrug efflux RND transporter permease subunit [Verrucomicrobiae bacterium]|nr:multidrug efflux RND transporter permease subunit [Verrucomicrobiae bacterium]
MFSIFFIRRPVFAAVISIVIVVVGLVALKALPVARYPEIAPPTVKISAVYPGANARTVADTVATPIEQEVNGVEGMIYMSSVSSNDGSMNLTVTFEPGTDLDTANVLTQNRVAVAEARLPEDVKRTGVTVKKQSTDVVMYIGFSSPGGTYDDQYLSNYVNLRVKDELARIDGVGEVQVFGAGQFSMRVWLDPEKLETYQISASDVVNAIRQQNVQVAGGRIGGAPALEGIAYEYTVNVEGRLSESIDFEDIVVKTGETGALVRVRDVARVELGSDSYSISSQLNGKDSATVAIYQIPGSNIIDVAAGINQRLAELAQTFPDDLEFTIVYDNTDIIRASIKNVVITLISALILVILTVYIFLQNFRATIIPSVTIPVALIGTFAVLLAMGYSLNQLTLFGLVLVIGIVVDDAIVVVENTTRWIEEGLSPREAAEKAMLEVSGPVIATTLVLLAVFVPTLAMGGITGTLFKQFAVTISIATVFSSINALTLSPALSALLLRKQKEPKGLFRAFNLTLEKTTNAYLGVTRLAIRRAVLSVILFAGMAAAAVWGLGQLPTGFVPQEDEGYCMVNVQLPDGSSMQRTQAVLKDINHLVSQVEGTGNFLTIAGYSIIDGAASANTGFLVVTFKPWSERSSKEQHQTALVNKLNRMLYGYRDAVAFAFPMPSLPGVGASGGFTFMLQDRGGVGFGPLQEMAGEIIQDGNAQAGLERLNTTFRSSVPQLFVDIDREQVFRSGTSLSSVFDTLQSNLGSVYVNDFTLFGRIFKVTAQADAKFRDEPEAIRRLQVRNQAGQMVPIGSIASVDSDYGPQTVTRFNLYPSVKILGNAAPGYSSGEALDIMEDMAADKLPDSMGFSWSELSYQEKLAAGGTSAIFIFAILMVYLVLAAQYESWSIPVSVVLSVPTAIFGAMAAIWLRHMDNNVYTQIGIVLLIGLSTKSAILIVEFAKVLREEGKSTLDAAIEATRLRFRAVLMTAFSFILGVIPLLIASGAGAESQKVIGTSVFGGMIAATVLSLAAVPMLYYVVQRLVEGKQGKATESASTAES